MIHTDVHVDIWKYMYEYTDTHNYMYIHLSIYVCLHIHMFTCVYIYMYTRMCLKLTRNYGEMHVWMNAHVVRSLYKCKDKSMSISINDMSTYVCVCTHVHGQEHWEIWKYVFVSLYLSFSCSSSWSLSVSAVTHIHATPLNTHTHTHTGDTLEHCTHKHTRETARTSRQLLSKMKRENESNTWYVYCRLLGGCSSSFEWFCVLHLVPLCWQERKKSTIKNKGARRRWREEELRERQNNFLKKN